MRASRNESLPAASHRSCRGLPPAQMLKSLSKKVNVTLINCCKNIINCLEKRLNFKIGPVSWKIV